jgi:hypothetical protein
MSVTEASLNAGDCIDGVHGQFIDGRCERCNDLSPVCEPADYSSCNFGVRLVGYHRRIPCIDHSDQGCVRVVRVLTSQVILESPDYESPET